MLNIVTSPETLWQECSQLLKKKSLIASELQGKPYEHVVFSYGPVAQRNQFQALLYSAHNQFNISMLPIHDLGLFAHIPWPSEVLCHFHWLHGKTSQAKSEAEADASVDYWESLLRGIKANGNKIMWTIHNVLPHETIWIEQAKRIRQILADEADILHIMASDSVKLVDPYFTLDDRKLILVPHPSYDGAQPNDISQSDARAKLKIREEETVLLTFGAIMEYKGYDLLMDAYDKLRIGATRSLRLIIAGLPSDKNLVQQIIDWGKDKTDVILNMNSVPQDELQIYFQAANIAVCPYRQSLNSGAAMLAFTFNLPVIAPNNGGFADLSKAGCSLTYDPLDPEGLYHILQRAIQKGVQDNKENIMKVRHQYSPEIISKYFFECTLRRLRGQ